MLAKQYAPKRVSFPCFVQPKLDGVRCITDGEHFWSRNGKLFPDINLKHLCVPHLRFLVDGELMLDGESFEDTISAIKNASTEDRTRSAAIQFYAFDVITKEEFRDRRHSLDWVLNHANDYTGHWQSVPTIKIADMRWLLIFARQMLRQGHEGTMIRSPYGRYESKRSDGLLKWKPLMDDEFKIIGVKEAKGKDKGTPVFICATKRGSTAKEFRARPRGTMAQRRSMWRDRKSLIGKKLTVEFQYFMKSGRPRHPRAKVLRDYE
jgi:DNA ligase-1